MRGERRALGRGDAGILGGDLDRVQLGETSFARFATSEGFSAVIDARGGENGNGGPRERKHVRSVEGVDAERERDRKSTRSAFEIPQ